MNIEITANKIAAKYLALGEDMNDSIAKYASENNLNIEQTKRLVEESNKNCYLQKFASTGEQTFDVAQFNIVKEKISLIDKVEKTASIKFTEVGEFEKTASEEIETIHYDQAIAQVRSEIGSLLVKTYSLEKTASCETEETKTLKNEIERKEKIIDILIEKRAGIITGVAGTTLKGGAKVAGFTAGKIIEYPGKSLNALSIGASAKHGASKIESQESHIMNKMASENNLEKKAFSVGEILEEALPYAKATGLIGLGVAAAKAGGGIVSKMMQERQLNESFDTITKVNSDIRQIPNARAYYDVIARHSPSLALDPMVAPQLIRQFDTFGGVDINTVDKLRSIESRGQSQNTNSSLDVTGNLIGSIGSFKKFMQKKQD